MNIIDEIKLYVKHGKLVLVQDSAKYFFIATVNNNKIYRLSKFCKFKEDLVLGLSLDEVSCSFIEDGNIKLVGQYDLPTEPFKVGQKVKVREDLKNIFDVSEWGENKKDMIGKMFLVETIYNDNDGISYSLKTPFTITGCFRHDWLLPVLPTRTVDDVLAGLSAEDKAIIKERLR